jgi:hypothetical protein
MPPIETVLAENEALKGKVETLSEKVAGLEAELSWFKKQIFGSGKNEKQPPDRAQLLLKLGQLQAQMAEVKTQKITYERREPGTPRQPPEETFKDLPVKETIEIIPPEVLADPDLYERIGEETTVEIDLVLPQPYKRLIVRPKYRHRLDRSRPPLVAPAMKRPIAGGYASVLIAVVFLLTRRRVIPDMTARAPERRIALRETILLLAYAALGQAGGWIIGSSSGYRPFSFHIAGTVFDCSVPPAHTEVWIWALYNFLVYTVAPYLYFRRRYSNAALNLFSTDRRNDALIILIVLAIESAFELSLVNKSIFSLSPHQALLGAPLSFVIFLIGTVLPTMVLIYAILLPRYLKLTGSAISASLLGGLTYAAMHIVEGSSAFDSPRNVFLSLIFVLFTYFGSGMFKSVLTLRTGNAWVHAISYHAIAPHVIIDTPLVVKVFGIR